MQLALAQSREIYIPASQEAPSLRALRNHDSESQD